MVLPRSAVSERPPAASRRLVAVVVTYNRLDKLKTTLARFLDSPPDHLERIVVIDNASTDGTADWLTTQGDARLVVERLPENRGGAGGFEAGMRFAVKRFDPDWLVLSDDDGRPAPGALAAFQAADLTGWEAVAAAVYFPGGEVCDINRPWRNPFWHPRVFLGTALGVFSLGLLGRSRDAFHVVQADYDGATPKAMDGASFVGLFLSRDAVARTGYPDPGLYIYGDDVDYTLRLRRAGGHMAFWPGIRFEHDFSTFQAGARRFRPLWKTYYHHRNLLIVYRQAAGLWFWLILVLVLPKWLLRTRDHGGERGTFLRLLGLAIWHGLCRIKTVPHARILTLSETSAVEDRLVVLPQEQEAQNHRDQGAGQHID